MSPLCLGELQVRFTGGVGSILRGKDITISKGYYQTGLTGAAALGKYVEEIAMEALL